MKLQTLRDLVDLLPAYGNRPAVGLRQEFGLRWWSYRRLYEEAHRAAAQLRDRGIQPGEHVLLWASNSPEWMAFLLGAALHGVIVVPVDEGASLNRVQQLAEEVKPTLLIHGATQNASVVDIPSQSIYALNGVVNPLPEEEPALSVDPDDPVLILYTSGTTIHPKGVILTHRNLLSQIEPFLPYRWLVRIFPLRILCLTPLSHVQGLVLGIIIPLSLGLSVIYSHSVNPAHVIRTIKQNRVTLLVAVPRIQHLLAKTLQQLPYHRPGLTLGQRVKSIRFFPLRRHILFRATHASLGYWFWLLLVGGATLPKADEQFWFDSGYFLVQGYGLTETAAIVSVNVNTPFSKPKGSIGKPLVHQTVRLAEDGEILVRGPNVTPGYFHDDESQAQAARGEFLPTGDLAWRDSRNRLYFLGRKKEIIVTGEGFNVYPQEVEAVLNQMSEVVEAVVLPMEREGHEEVHAVLLLKDNAKAARIVRQANSELEPHQKIRSWTVWAEEDFPRATLFKVKREEVSAAIRYRQEALSSEPSTLDVIPSIDMIRETWDKGQRLRLLARYLLESDAAQPESEPLHLVRDLGLSSLDVVELLSLLEQRDHVPFKDAIVPENTSLTDLRAMMKGTNPARDVSVKYTELPVKMDTPFISLLRTFLAPLVIPIWLSSRVRLTTTGVKHLAAIHPPFIVAATHHKHGLDAMAIYCALPRRLRKNLLLVTSQWIFRDYLDPAREAPLISRIVAAVAFHFGMPVLFPFALWPHFGTTREGFLETGRLIDRRFSLIIFPERERNDNYTIRPGIGVIAAQTQIPIIPLRLQGNIGLDFRPRRPSARSDVLVQFGQPIHVTSLMTADDVIAAIESAFAQLR